MNVGKICFCFSITNSTVIKITFMLKTTNIDVNTKKNSHLHVHLTSFISTLKRSSIVKICEN